MAPCSDLLIFQTQFSGRQIERCNVDLPGLPRTLNITSSSECKPAGPERVDGLRVHAASLKRHYVKQIRNRIVRGRHPVRDACRRRAQGAASAEAQDMSPPLTRRTILRAGLRSTLDLSAPPGGLTKLSGQLRISSGMLDSTLVVWGREFGPTPLAEGKNGSDHHPCGFSMWVTSAGIKGGRVHGSSDEFGSRPPVYPADSHDGTRRDLALDGTRPHEADVFHLRQRSAADGRAPRRVVHGVSVEWVASRQDAGQGAGRPCPAIGRGSTFRRSARRDAITV
ncbi:MAG: DUF1501 domain-containing protein [Bryobacterales bacterium]|nr:DUF1501 domain-containing protein [Bryobacterales bacterium]